MGYNYFGLAHSAELCCGFAFVFYAFYREFAGVLFAVHQYGVFDVIVAFLAHV